MKTQIITAVVWFILERYPDIVAGVLNALGCHIHKNPRKKEAVSGEV